MSSKISSSLASIKAKVQHATRLTDYKDRHQAISSANDLRITFDAVTKAGDFQETLGLMGLMGQKADQDYADLIDRGKSQSGYRLANREVLTQTRGNWERGGE